jgi:hypothetical protein
VTAGADGRRGSAAPSILASPRSAFRAAVLVPAWLWLWAVEGAVSRSDPLAGQLLSAFLLGAGGLLLWAWAAFDGARTASRGEAPALAERVRALRGALRRLFLVPLVTCFPAAFFLLVALVVAVALGHVPAAGGWLGRAWVFTGGLVLSLLAAGWALLAIASLPLEVAASVADEDATAMEVFTWATYTARARPLRLAAGWLLVLAGTAAGAAAFLAFFLLAASIIVVLEGAAAGSPPSPASFDPLWTLAASPRGWIPCGGWMPPPGAPGWFVHAARFLPAFALASILAGTGRLHAALRRERAGP